MRIVVKVGTSTIAYPTGNMNIRHMENLCKVLSDIKNAGNEVILVSSGAVGMGMGKLSLKNRPKLLSLKQAVASVGQCELMYTYDKLFSEHNHTVAQILLTADDVNNKVRCKNYTNTINKLFELGVLPIINENDTVATSELLIGDNDTLAATVAKTVNADILILLSDIDGLYTADPSKNKKAKLIKEIKEITPDIEALAGGSGSKVGTGGMVTKINAAKIVNAAGCDMIIANGKTPELLYDIIEGKSVGTRFLGVKK
ncbi:MAG: glutamate 5-kinase [Clostridiales bacterium]|nr:glutamate 5-kinase [Clostridiales bacterium]